MPRYHVCVSYSTHADEPRDAVAAFFEAVSHPGAMIAQVFDEGSDVPVEEFDDADLDAIAQGNRPCA